jgi:hypothetical protein
MRRRDFIAGLGAGGVAARGTGAAASWNAAIGNPVAAQRKRPRDKGLALCVHAGWTEGNNLRIDVRWNPRTVAEHPSGPDLDEGACRGAHVGRVVSTDFFRSRGVFGVGHRNIPDMAALIRIHGWRVRIFQEILK